ncbi:MAG TPA: heme exporter protein CcmD [Sphingomicrobium sp.]|nr:heme exporter protein CcmD [Sphingomicrobium sp.]
MSHWPFVIAAYTFAIGATAALIVQSFVSMRRAEARAERLRDRK